MKNPTFVFRLVAAVAVWFADCDGNSPFTRITTYSDGGKSRLNTVVVLFVIVLRANERTDKNIMFYAEAMGRIDSVIVCRVYSLPVLFCVATTS